LRFELPPYDQCSFCDDLAGRRECAMIAENDHAFAELDERQYERGALLVLPKQHRESILEIQTHEIEAVYRLAKEVAQAATRAFGALGMNVFQNNGTKAGQHEPHFHVHVVPRYRASDPNRRFLQRDYDVISMHEQRAIAALIRAQL
jgi:histidine triad (HIT) family protein